MKIISDETIRRVREVLGGPRRAWQASKLPPARIAFVPFTLAEVEILPDDRRCAPSHSDRSTPHERLSASPLFGRSRLSRLGAPAT